MQVDYLKEDSCYVDSNDRYLGYQQYSAMRDALASTGRQIGFGLCGNLLIELYHPIRSFAHNKSQSNTLRDDMHLYLIER